MVTPIGFYFPLGSSAYTHFSVTSSGDLVFGDTPIDRNTNYMMYPLHGSGLTHITPKINILGLYGYASDSSYVKKTLVGTAPNRELIVEFFLNIIQTNSRTFHWQVHLHENGNIEIVFPSQSKQHL